MLPGDISSRPEQGTKPTWKMDVPEPITSGTNARMIEAGSIESR